MKPNQFFLMLLVLIGFSCTGKQEDYGIENKLKPEILKPIKITIISNLPDSLQPKNVFLDKMPALSVVAIPKSRVVTKMLPVLQNENGEPILDAEGKPYIMGDGGKSNFTNFTTDNGLALDAVTCSLLDKFGNLWFGTFGGGVSRYDGKSFRNFTLAQGLAHNAVWCITEDKSGNLWFGTAGGGISRYDGKTFSTFTTDQGLAHNFVRNITEDKRGNLWIATGGGGVSRYDGKSFSTFSIAQGLAHNVVWSITEDKTGNLWFATGGGGVSRYDGNSFITFTTAQGLANNTVRSISEDKSGNLWFGTLGGGVSRYDGESFKTFATAQGLASNHVYSISEEKTGVLWFGTLGGVSRYDGESFSSFTTAQGLANNQVYSITEDKTGSIWFGTFSGGVSRYDGNSFNSFTTAEGLAHNVVSSITEDKTGNLWFGTYGGGVSRYDGKSFSTFTTEQGLTNNTVRSITEDKFGNLWFGTLGGGVSRFDGKSFSTFTTTQGLAYDQVFTITEDKMGNLWFGTLGGGVSRYDGQSFRTFTTAQGLADNFVFCITEDKMGNLWFGTLTSGVSRYDGKSFSNFSQVQGLANNFVRCITMDNTGNLWFGTVEGLSVMPARKVGKLAGDPDLSGVEEENKGKKRDIIDSTLFKTFKIADGLPDNVVTQVIQMSDGKMAVGTNLGITLFNPSPDLNKLTDIEIYSSSTGYPVKDLNIGQHTMLLDSKEIIWAGTGSEKTALVRFDPSAVKIHMEAATLVIQSLKVNEESIPWYDLKDNPVAVDSIAFPTYVTEEVGLFGRELTVLERDSLQQRFDGIQFNGIRPFYPVPEKLVLPHEHNHISFEFVAIETSRPFMVKYQYMLEGYDKDWSPITSRSNATFGNIAEGTYTFKLKAQGANGVWTDPVIYTFRVLPPWWRSWWAYGGYGLILGLLGFAFNSVQQRRLIQKERERAEEKRKELELQQAAELKVAYAELAQAHVNLKSTQEQLIQSEKIATRAQQAEALRLKELDAVKTKLYTNITHEFRTPLTVILGVANQVLDNPNEHLNKGLNMIIRNGQNLLMLVNQMLDLSKLESGKLSLQYHHADVISFLGYIIDSFHSLAETKGLQFHFISVKEQLYMDFDEVRLQQIVSNIFSNAIKFTPKGGHVYVLTDIKNDSFILKIKDTGIGIAEEDLSQIFDRFFQADDSHTRHGEGTGIGLALTHELVKLMKGSIAVKSKKGQGAEFEVVLPLRNISDSEPSHEVPTELIDLDMQYEDQVPIDEVYQSSSIIPVYNENGSAHILIADDNEDVLAFVASCLEDEFAVHVAKNGQECEEMAFNSIPDLIVMDVMMPIKDGYEVCKTLKADERTSHIPIILLTAKADLKSKLQGLERGADDYLTKPFHKKELLFRIKNLLDLRRHLQQYYRSSLEASLSVNSLQNPNGSTLNSEINGSKSTHLGIQNPRIPLPSSLENGFVIKVRKAIESHLEEPDFDVEKLCRNLALSHSQVHRKLSALTGLSATHFIRYVRLIKAKDMILKSGFSITAIAYDCGFNDPGYFGRIFKKEFGISPQVWREQNST